jgi:hypothetical protein
MQLIIIIIIIINVIFANHQKHRDTETAAVKFRFQSYLVSHLK